MRRFTLVLCVGVLLLATAVQVSAFSHSQRHQKRTAGSGGMDGGGPGGARGSLHAPARMHNQQQLQHQQGEARQQQMEKETAFSEKILQRAQAAPHTPPPAAAAAFSHPLPPTPNPQHAFDDRDEPMISNNNNQHQAHSSIPTSTRGVVGDVMAVRKKNLNRALYKRPLAVPGSVERMPLLANQVRARMAAGRPANEAQHPNRRRMGRKETGFAAIDAAAARAAAAEANPPPRQAVGGFFAKRQRKQMMEEEAEKKRQREEQHKWRRIKTSGHVEGQEQQRRMQEQQRMRRQPPHIATASKKDMHAMKEAQKRQEEEEREKREQAEQTDEEKWNALESSRHGSNKVVQKLPGMRGRVKAVGGEKGQAEVMMTREEKQARMGSRYLKERSGRDVENRLHALAAKNGLKTRGVTPDSPNAVYYLTVESQPAGKRALPAVIREWRSMIGTENNLVDFVVAAKNKVVMTIANGHNHEALASRVASFPKVKAVDKRHSYDPKTTDAATVRRKKHHQAVRKNKANQFPRHSRSRS